MTTRPHWAAHAGEDDAAALAAGLRDALRPQYLLADRLGEGGMGAVYRAREPSLKRDVAVKVMLPWLAQDPTGRARFEREAHAVAAVSHPNVINIYGTGELDDGTPYFVMQFISGRSLEERVAADGPLSVRETRRVLAEVAAALAAAHERGIVHRDIKAANVLQDAASGRVVVTDFGIAAVRSAPDQPAAKLTRPDDGSPGTPLYMSPEQLMGEPTTEASDVYAFGLLAYELLTGEGPFRATSPHEIAAAHLRDTPPPLTTLRADVDAELEHLVASCLFKKPEERPTAAQLVQRLPPGDAFSLEWPPPGLEPLAGQLPRLNRRLGLGATMLTIAMLSFVTADPAEGVALPLWLLEAAALLGGLLLVAGVSRASVLLREVRRAQRRGYGWLSVMEVVSDPRGDTGALITGMRDYASLKRTDRSRLRALRLFSAGMGFVAAVAPVFTFLLALRFASNGALSPLGLIAAVALPALLLLDGVLVLRWLEHRAARGRRGRRKKGAAPPAGADRAVVDAWRDSFETARAGQPLGATVPNPLATRLTMRLGLALATIGFLATAPLALLPVLGRVVSSAAVPKFSTTRKREAVALAGAAWAPRTDSSITPAAAGAAMHALTIGVGPVLEGLRTPSPRLATALMPAGTDNPFGAWVGGIQDSLLRWGARRSLTAAQTAWLEGLARHPAWPLVRTAARAPRADLITARNEPEALARWRPFRVPIPRVATLKEAGFASTAIAALRLQQGRRDDAEAMLRDAVGLGLREMHDGVFVLETLIGASIATNALERLMLFYELTGRPGEATRMRAARDSARDAADRASEVEDAAFARYAAAPEATYRSGILRLLSDSTLSASLRWESVFQATFMPCTNARELVFGPSPDLAAAVASFARQVLRTPGDSAWFQLVTQAAASSDEGMIGTINAGYSALLGSPRWATCARLILGN